MTSHLTLNENSHFFDPEYVHRHLQTSDAVPLVITITLPDDLAYDAEIPAIGELRKAVDRIKSLTIDAPYHEAWQKFVSGIGEGQAAPILERLVLAVREDVSNVDNNGPFTTLSTAFNPSPQLVHLQLPAWPLPAQPPPQFATVTSLTFDTPFSGLDIPALFPLIQAAPHLQKFTFKAVDMGAESDPNYSNIISVPQLLSADVTTPGFGLDLLGNFDAPLLTDVRLDGYRDGIPEVAWEEADWGIDVTQPASKILAHLSARSPGIRRLELKYVQFEPAEEEFTRILSGHALPALEELILERTNIPDAALRAATQSSLKKLELRNCAYVTFDALQVFAQGRSGSDFTLVVEGCPAISKENVHALSKIVNVTSD